MPTVDVAEASKDPCPNCPHYYTGEPCGLVIGPDGQPMDCPVCEGNGYVWSLVERGTIDYE